MVTNTATTKTMTLPAFPMGLVMLSAMSKAASVLPTMAMGTKTVAKMMKMILNGRMILGLMPSDLADNTRSNLQIIKMIRESPSRRT